MIVIHNVNVLFDTILPFLQKTATLDKILGNGMVVETKKYIMEKVKKIIVANDLDGIIGHDLDMPWGHLTDDLKLLNYKTKGGENPINGNPVIIGHNTAKALVKMIGKPFPGRTTIVVTTSGNPDLEALGFIVTKGENSFEEAVFYAEHHCPGKEIWFAGGGKLYKEAFEKQRIIEVHETIIEAHFPAPEGVTPIYFERFQENDYWVDDETAYLQRDPFEKDKGNAHNFIVRVHILI